MATGKVVGSIVLATDELLRFGHCDCPWVRGLLQTWWLMGFSEFEIFFFVWIGCEVFLD